MAEQSSMHNASASIQEWFTIVCLDAGVESSAQLESYIPLWPFERVLDCLDFIRSQPEGKQIILIVSDRMAQEIVPSIEHLPQVVKIYIRSTNGGNNGQYGQSQKVRRVGPQLSDLVREIRAYQNRLERFNEQMSTSVEAKDFSRPMSPINDIICYEPAYEEQGFTSENIYIARYTQDKFFYRMINDAYRDRHPVAHEHHRSIRLLYEALQQAQITEPICVYRGQTMQNQEVDILRNSVGRNIVMNSFLSATPERDVALIFSGWGTKNVDGMVSVLYVIHGTYQQNMRPFADISQYSSFRDEREILFWFGSIFRIDEVTQTDDGLITINMTVIGYDEDEPHNLNI